jgi:hypothetical protein
MMHLMAKPSVNFLNATSPGPRFPYDLWSVSAILQHDYELQVLVCRILRSASIKKLVIFLA